MWHSNLFVYVYYRPGTTLSAFLHRSTIWMPSHLKCLGSDMCRNSELGGFYTIIHVTGSRAAPQNKKQYFYSNFGAASHSQERAPWGSLHSGVVQDPSLPPCSQAGNGVGTQGQMGLPRDQQERSSERTLPRLMGAEWPCAEAMHINRAQGTRKLGVLGRHRQAETCHT